MKRLHHNQALWAYRYCGKTFVCEQRYTAEEGAYSAEKNGSSKTSMKAYSK